MGGWPYVRGNRVACRNIWFAYKIVVVKYFFE